MLKENKTGEKYWAYGGDYGSPGVPSDGNFLINGVVFRDLSNVKYRWELLENGFPVTSGEADPIAVSPRTDTLLQIDLPELQSQDKEYLLIIRALTDADEPLIEAEHEIVAEQFYLQGKYRPEPSSEKARKIEMFRSGGLINLAGDNFSVAFDESTGALMSIVDDGAELLKHGFFPDFWRPPTDNDFGYRMPEKQKMWKEASQIRELKSFEIGNRHGKFVSAGKIKGKKKGKVFIFRSRYWLPAVSATAEMVYTVNNHGEVKIEASISGVSDTLPDLPRFGVSFKLNKFLGRVEWYGRGPHENYCDRKTSALSGLYAADVGELYVPYIRPQENGHYCDVRWVSFSGLEQQLLVEAESLIEFNAHFQGFSDFDPGEIKKQRHTTDIHPRDFVAVNIDYGVTGVGGDDSWGAHPHPQYSLSAGEYRLVFVLKIKVD